MTEEILNTESIRIFPPAQKLVVSTETLRDSLTGEVVTLVEVPNRGVWTPLPLPSIALTDEYREVLRMHTEGIPHPKLHRGLWVWFWILIVGAATSLTLAIIAWVRSDWYTLFAMCGAFILFSAVLSVIVMEYEESRQRQVIAVARSRARHRRE